jgi:hypothetical protein
MAGIRLMVQPSDEGIWQVRVGYAPWRHFQSQHAAISAALERARAMSRDGIECEVVMKIMTCQFGANGFFKAVPTARDIDWDLSDELPGDPGSPDGLPQ